MGVNLHICTRDGKDAPVGWDWFRHAGDRELAMALGSDDLRGIYEFDDVQEEGFYKLDPSSVREFCKRFDTNEARWEMLAWIFENKPDLWLRVSW
jgi:hypothetical protein